MKDVTMMVIAHVMTKLAGKEVKTMPMMTMMMWTMMEMTMVNQMMTKTMTVMMMVVVKEGERCGGAVSERGGAGAVI